MNGAWHGAGLSTSLCLRALRALCWSPMSLQWPKINPVCMAVPHRFDLLAHCMQGYCVHTL
jgi:hypothetical protein